MTTGGAPGHDGRGAVHVSCAGSYIVIPPVRQYQVRCPVRPSTHWHGSQYTTTRFGPSGCRRGQVASAGFDRGHALLGASPAPCSVLLKAPEVPVCLSGEQVIKEVDVLSHN